MTEKGYRKHKLEGTKIGRWTVVSFYGTVNNHYKYNCICECGSKKIVDGNALKRGLSKSCGCYIADKHKKEPGHANATIFFSNYKQQAKKRKIKFLISKKDFLDIAKNDCYYCGDKPKKITKIRKNGQYISNGIDRVDNKKGYLKTNCVACCSKCNYAKHVMTHEEFINHVCKIYRRWF